MLTGDSIIMLNVVAGEFSPKPPSLSSHTPRADQLQRVEDTMRGWTGNTTALLYILSLDLNNATELDEKTDTEIIYYFYATEGIRITYDTSARGMTGLTDLDLAQ